MRDGLFRSGACSASRLAHQREAEADQEPALLGLLDADRAAVARGDLGRDGQPETGSRAVLLPAPEPRRRPRQIFVGKAGAVVADDQIDRVGLLPVDTVIVVPDPA